MSLLPPNASRIERAIEYATRLDLPVDIADLSNPSTCPVHALPWLAWELHVDNWNIAESEEQKRAVIRSSVAVHRKKGTPWSIREVFRTLGFGEIEIIENVGRLSYDGAKHYDGQMFHGVGESTWPVYRVLMTRPITNDQAEMLRAILVDVAPARCHLASLEYRGVPIRYNGTASHNRSYNYGSA
jgi:phage tail P2-like protein